MRSPFMLCCSLFLLLPVGVWAYQEAPVLHALVEAGALPPVDERLPENPAVVTPVNEIGVYGGSWRRLAVGLGDVMMTDRLGYEPLVRWDRSGQHVIPNLAERWEVLDGGTRYRFHLRKGLRWSDGHPFTSDDLMFWYEDMNLNEDLTPVPLPWLLLKGQQPDVTAPDAFTVDFSYPEPYGLFLESLAYQGSLIIYPKHYLSQFHPRYASEDDLQRLQDTYKMDHWTQVFLFVQDPRSNPDLPTMKPFVMEVAFPATRMPAKRNPYYWKVDPEGNQLPYIDEIVFTQVQNTEIGNFKAMTGEVDFQARFMNAQHFTMFMRERKRGDYYVLHDEDPLSSVVYINQHSKDDRMRALLQNRNFRIALNLAINREELVDLIYAGLATPSRGVSSAYDPYYLPEFNERHCEYNPTRANALLDELGMKRGLDGLRRMPDGSRFKEILHCHPSELGTSMDQWQLVTDYWREVGLDFAVKVNAPTLSVLQTRNGNTNFWGYATVGMHWPVNASWYIPLSDQSYFAPLYGQYYQTHGESGVQPSEEHQRILDRYNRMLVCTDEAEKLALGQAILRQWSEEAYTVGIVHQRQLTIVSNRFKNVPDEIIHSYRVMTPGYIGIEQFYIDEGDTP